ncbi:MAG: TerB family tellurite resistance protein [Chloroflexi bacterium]|nr:TerB family tellurite resistance protein [Chloroflexota bacterium]
MPVEDPIRRAIAGWFVHKEWRIPGRMPAGNAPLIAKATLICAKGDGVVAEAERDWVLGYALTAGFSDDEVEYLRNYEANEDIATVLNAGEISSRADMKMAAIYLATSVCYADGELAEGEIATLVRMGEALGIAETKVQEIIAAFMAEMTAQQNRINLIFQGSQPY